MAEKGFKAEENLEARTGGTNFLQGRQGAVMLEATYCILVCLLVMIFFISFGFYVYQKSIFRIACNEAAEELVWIYKLEGTIDNSHITERDVSGIGMYRYLFGNAHYEKENAKRAQTVFSQRLSAVSMAKSEAIPSVEIHTIVDDIGRRHYEVKISQEYRFFLGDLLRAIGGRDAEKLEATVYVSGVDALHYINTVKLTKYALEKAVKSNKILGIINSSIKLVKSMAKIFYNEPSQSYQSENGDAEWMFDDVSGRGEEVEQMSPEDGDPSGRGLHGKDRSEPVFSNGGGDW